MEWFQTVMGHGEQSPSGTPCDTLFTVAQAAFCLGSRYSSYSRGRGEGSALDHHQTPWAGLGACLAFSLRGLGGAEPRPQPTLSEHAGSVGRRQGSEPWVTGSISTVSWGPRVMERSDLGDLGFSRQDFPVWHRVQSHSLPFLGAVLQTGACWFFPRGASDNPQASPSPLGCPPDCWGWAPRGRGTRCPEAQPDAPRAQHAFPALQELNFKSRCHYIKRYCPKDSLH